MVVAYIGVAGEGSPKVYASALGEEVTIHGAGGSNRESQGFSPMMRKPVLAGRAVTALGSVVDELHQAMGQALHNCAVYCVGTLNNELDTLKVLCKAIGLWLVGSSIKGGKFINAIYSCLRCLGLFV